VKPPEEEDPSPPPTLPSNMSRQEDSRVTTLQRSKVIERKWGSQVVEKEDFDPGWERIPV